MQNTSLSSNVELENVSNNAVSRSEPTKLSLQPHQVKRKKKAGGYNLRKSLAWNHAFFTEEGVLNSTELSLISGNLGESSGEKLLVIEEEIESLLGDSQDLKVLEGNLFKKLPTNNSNKEEQKKIGSNLLQKSFSSGPRSTVKQNVLSVHDVNRSGSKRSGCPRPVMSTAPANVSSTKATIKEPKFSKIPTLKPDSSVLSTATKSVPKINKPNRNQSAQPTINAHRNIGLTGSNKSTKSIQKDAKPSLSSRSQITKSSAQQTKRCVIKIEKLHNPAS